MKNETAIKWVEVCQMILHRYLPPILKQFDDFVDGKCDILRDTSTVLALLKCANFLPNWTNEKPIEILSTASPIRVLDIKFGFEQYVINMTDGENVLYFKKTEYDQGVRLFKTSNYTSI